VGEPHSNISGILLDIGPGSFTGCRVSCAVAKALAFDLDIMIHTISSLEVLHFQNSGETTGQRLSVINAHRGLYYVWDHEAKATALLTKADLEMKIEALLEAGGNQNSIAGDFDFSEFPRLRGKKEEISSKNFLLPSF
jgi:tRNA A37 threonylcarbamoyladenosine modification protein TsaB